MAEITVSQVVRVPLADLWQSWDRFDEIYRFNPVISQSPLLSGSATSGLGAERHCKHVDGKTYLKERIIGYRPEEHLVIDIYDANIPLKNAVVTMRIRFTPKYGPIGWLMTPLIKMQFRKGLSDLLIANADFVENGVEIHPKAAA